MNELYARADQDCGSRINCSSPDGDEEIASPSAVVTCSRVGRGRRGVVASLSSSVSIYRDGWCAFDDDLENVEG